MTQERGALSLLSGCRTAGAAEAQFDAVRA